MFKIYLFILEIVVCIIDAVLASWFISRFNGSKLIRPTSIGFFLIYSAFNISNLFVLVFSVPSTLINMLLLLMFSFCNIKQKGVKCLFSPFIFEGTLILVNTLIVVAAGLIVGFEVSAVMNDQGIIRAILLVLSKFTIWLTLLIILKITSKTSSFKLQDYFLLILFPITLFFELVILIKFSLLHSMEHLYGYFFAAILSILLTYIGIYYMTYKIVEQNKLKSQNELYEQMLRFEERRYLDIEEGLQQINKIRHDIKHQISLTKMKLEEKDYIGVEKELNRILNNASSVGNIVKTDNKVVDYILNTKLGKIKDTNIVIAGNVGDLELIDDIDLSIILGNIIDNAIEAISDIKEARIELLFYRKNFYQNIICKNTISTSVLSENPNLNTTKTDKKNHGFGLVSAQEIITRYGGQISFYEEENLFNVHIMLPMV